MSRGGLLSLPASLSLNGAPSAVLECAVNCSTPAQKAADSAAAPLSTISLPYRYKAGVDSNTAHGDGQAHKHTQRWAQPTETLGRPNFGLARVCTSCAADALRDTKRTCRRPPLPRSFNIRAARGAPRRSDGSPC